MICSTCKEAAEMSSQQKIKEATKLHKKCKDCECQHKTGPGWFVRKGEAVPPMRTQSP
jgi:hypothetical protein